MVRKKAEETAAGLQLNIKKKKNVCPCVYKNIIMLAECQCIANNTVVIITCSEYKHTLRRNWQVVAARLVVP